MGKRRANKAKREDVADHFPDPRVHKAIAVEVALIDPYDQVLGAVERSLTRRATAPDVQPFARLPSVPGIGQSLAVVLLAEMHDIPRFARGPDFVSSWRLVTGAKASNGKRLGPSGKKIGTVPLRWAFAEAAVLFIRQSQPGKDYVAKLDPPPGKAKALTVLAHTWGRAVDYLRTRAQAFDRQRFVTASPLRGETEPGVELAPREPPLAEASSLYTALTVPDPLDEKLRAGPRDWTGSPAPLLGDPSPSPLWLPLPRVGHSRGVFSDTTRSCEKTGMRAQTSFSDVAPAGATVSRGTVSTETLILHRCVVQLQAVTSNRNEVSRRSLRRTTHRLFHRRPPRPRRASVCPLDIGGLIGGRRVFAPELFPHSLSPLALLLSCRPLHCAFVPSLSPLALFLPLQLSLRALVHHVCGGALGVVVAVVVGFPGGALSSFFL